LKTEGMTYSGWSSSGVMMSAIAWAPAPQCWVLHRVDDTLPTEPDLAMVLQAAEELGPVRAGMGWSRYWTGSPVRYWRPLSTAPVATAWPGPSPRAQRRAPPALAP